MKNATKRRKQAMREATSNVAFNIKLAKIQQELDVQWLIYRSLNEAEERDVELLLSLKNELREEAISNIGIKIDR